LVACSPRPDLVIADRAAEIGTPHKIFFASSRAPGEMGGLSETRAPDVAHGMAVVSVPPNHQIGRVEVTQGVPDPKDDFALAELRGLNGGAAFRAALRAELASLPRGSRNAVIFVHGFNTNFAEGLFRAAQLTHDFQMDGVSVHYAWPSRGSPVGYAYDRDSALFARDGLEQLINDVNAAGAESVLLVGHSLGGHLSMEAMRQMSIRVPGSVGRKVDDVVLISPDMDVDVFRSQASQIGTLPQPFLIFTSERDGALALSARLSGEKNRLGNLKSAEDVADLNVTIIDVTEFSQLGDLGHFTVGSSPELIRILRNQGTVSSLINADASGRTGLAIGVVLTIQEATEIILTPVTAVAN